MEKKDILIVGGGHTGLYLARQFAERGHDVALFEKKAAVGDKIVCTGIVGEETFQRFGLPADCVVGRVQGLRFFSPTGFTFDFNPAQPLARILDRPKFNRYLAANAAAAGAQIKSGAQVESLKTDSEKAVLTVRENGGLREYHARAVVLATGVNHQLFKDAGLEPPQSFLGGAQVHVPHQGELRTHVFLGTDVAPGAFAWSVPLESGIARVGVLSRKTPAVYLKKLLQRFNMGGHESQFEIRPVMDRPAPRSYANRVLVVGEAAGQIKSSTAGGIYYGLLGADCAVKTLESAFSKNDFSPAFLKDYETAWRAIIGEELRFCYHCRKIFSRFTDAHMEELFRGKVREDLINLAYEKAAFEWHRGYIFSMLKMPRVLLHGLKHPLISAELFTSLLFGKIA